jgi:hypothetical protein
MKALIATSMEHLAGVVGLDLAAGETIRAPQGFRFAA